MIIHEFIWPVVLVSLSNANLCYQNSFSKPDYTIPYKDCQMEKNKDTMNHNYIKTQDLIEETNNKYQIIH